MDWLAGQTHSKSVWYTSLTAPLGPPHQLAVATVIGMANARKKKERHRIRSLYRYLSLYLSIHLETND